MYEFVDTMPTFMEADRVPKKDLHELECYGSYELEAPLNHFSDNMLNDHLYTMYKKGKLETPELMRKLLCFFSKRYRRTLEPKVNEYLRSKKLSMDDCSKKQQMRGHCVCIPSKHGDG